MNEGINEVNLDLLNTTDLSGLETMDTSLMLTPWMEDTLWLASIVMNILSLLFYISSAYWLFLINKKLGEKHAWLSFIPLLQIYNYFSASKKSVLHYLVLPILALIVW